MKIKILIAILIVLSAVYAAAAQNRVKTNSKTTRDDAAAQLLIENEKTNWKSLVEKKYDDFARAFADDYQGVYPQMVTTKASEMDAVRRMTFKAADVSDVKVSFPHKETAIVTSTVKMNVVMPDGREANDTMRATSVLVKRGKNWVLVYHSHVPVNM